MSHSFLTNQSDEPTRRAFLGGLASSLLGVSALPLLGASALASGDRRLLPATARSVIYIYLSGGMSHIDTFDLKPGTEEQGPTTGIATNVDDLSVTSHLKKMAKLMDKVCVINSMQSTQGAHSEGRYFLHTGYELRGTVQHPTMGAWLSRMAGGLNPSLPNHVEIGGQQFTASGGFLGQQHAPLPIGKPDAGLQDSHRSANVDKGTFDRRVERLREMNAKFREHYATDKVKSHSDTYEQALRLMTSRDLEAFNIENESASLRDAYGRTPLGQGALLARRLVEHGVRFVEVVDDGWDSHVDNFGEMNKLVPNLDNTLSTLLLDLDSRGMLEETLVVVTTEFGRTPIFGKERFGRNHHPKAFSSLLAGGGVRGGQVWGKTDATASEVLENPVSVNDFNATIAYALGLPLDQEIATPSGQEFTIADNGSPVTELFA